MKRSAPARQKGQRSKRRLPTPPRGRARPDEPLATWCEAGTSVCVGRATHRHHRRGRGPGLDASEFTIDVCTPCHDYIHAHPTESYQRGWLLKRGGPDR